MMLSQWLRHFLISAAVIVGCGNAVGADPIITQVKIFDSNLNIAKSIINDEIIIKEISSFLKYKCDTESGKKKWNSKIKLPDGISWNYKIVFVGENFHKSWLYDSNSGYLASLNYQGSPCYKIDDIAAFNQKLGL